ncbi:hypothetical protein [Crocosphaera sp. Alani8]|uniref:hypothetical protein n=1 Tax=Crocosphaera sp. Alani8 TaxID=3038952 RepID=UPI00313DFD1C
MKQSVKALIGASAVACIGLNAAPSIASTFIVDFTGDGGNLGNRVDFGPLEIAGIKDSTPFFLAPPPPLVDIDQNAEGVGVIGDFPIGDPDAVGRQFNVNENDPMDPMNPLGRFNNLESLVWTFDHNVALNSISFGPNSVGLVNIFELTIENDEITSINNFDSPAIINITGGGDFDLSAFGLESKSFTAFPINNQSCFMKPRQT